MQDLVVNFWDAFDHKREMPIVPATPEVYFRDREGHVWDLASELPTRFDPTGYEWDARLVITSLWPEVHLLWPVCERGCLLAILPKGQRLPPNWGGTQRVFWYADHPLPKSLGRWP